MEFRWKFQWMNFYNIQYIYNFIENDIDQV